jgi:hypothetical protein
MAQANAHAGGLQPASFQKLYASMPDVLNRQYTTTYLAPFGPKSGQQPATLRDRVITAANDVPKAFVLLQMDPTLQIICVHHPTRYASSLLGAQLWDDHIFGFQGDVRQGNQINLIKWPDTPFSRSVMVTMPLPDYMDDAWMKANGANAIGPYKQQRMHLPLEEILCTLCLAKTLFFMIGVVIGSFNPSRILLSWLFAASVSFQRQKCFPSLLFWALCPFTTTCLIPTFKETSCSTFLEVSPVVSLSSFLVCSCIQQLDLIISSRAPTAFLDGLATVALNHLEASW